MSTLKNSAVAREIQQARKVGIANYIQEVTKLLVSAVDSQKIAQESLIECLMNAKQNLDSQS